MIKWKDKIVEKPKTYHVQNNDDGTVTLIEAFGEISEAGTPVNATNMNGIGEKTYGTTIYDETIPAYGEIEKSISIPENSRYGVAVIQRNYNITHVDIYNPSIILMFSTVNDNGKVFSPTYPRSVDTLGFVTGEILVNDVRQRYDSTVVGSDWVYIEHFYIDSGSNTIKIKFISRTSGTANIKCRIDWEVE